MSLSIRINILNILIILHVYTFLQYYFICNFVIWSYDMIHGHYSDSENRIVICNTFHYLKTMICTDWLFWLLIFIVFSLFPFIEIIVLYYWTGSFTGWQFFLQKYHWKTGVLSTEIFFMNIFGLFNYYQLLCCRYLQYDMTFCIVFVLICKNVLSYS